MAEDKDFLTQLGGSKRSVSAVAAMWLIMALVKSDVPPEFVVPAMWAIVVVAIAYMVLDGVKCWLIMSLVKSDTMDGNEI